jgi:uracil phosphoribosyltransferase
MKTVEINHPLIHAKLTELRDETTPSHRFRKLTEELVSLLAYEATRELAVESVAVKTPVAKTTGVKFAEPVPMILPILRAGLGMLEGMLKIMPQAEVGFLGAVRNEQTLEISTYAERMPENLRSRHVFVLDPMLATGGTLITAAENLKNKGAKKITAICLLAAPEGLAKLKSELPNDLDFTLVIAGIDEKLNEVGYIVPGLGDAGDRLFGKVD